MSWFKKLLGSDEQEQAAPALPEAKKPPAPSPAFAEDNVVSSGTGGKKVKLDFKKVPKKVLEAIAAETTGQPRTIVLEGNAGEGLTKAFNDAASPGPKPMRSMSKAPKL